MGIVAQNTPFQFDFNRFLLFCKRKCGNRLTDSIRLLRNKWNL
ncbi:hypothetical protein LEP1GSC061_0335 [Leptospira wolffii serovar Khorat str. Khorat-H2]|nr:hypothetical protein LEP1GSC061_0335 [Leptospira wolffii serovar Khorat str. Khorat-H2]